jgi:hypothetical protein
MLKRTSVVSTIRMAAHSRPGFVRIRIEREAARPKLVWIYKPPPKPDSFPHWDEFASCPICHMRIQHKEEWATHAESQLHKDRVRWMEQEKWYANVGMPKLRQQEDEEWEWYKQKVLAPRAEKEGIPLENLEREARKARVPASPLNSTGADYPAIRDPLWESKNATWPRPRGRG